MDNMGLIIDNRSFALSTESKGSMPVQVFQIQMHVPNIIQTRGTQKKCHILMQFIPVANHVLYLLGAINFNLEGSGEGHIRVFYNSLTLT